MWRQTFIFIYTQVYTYLNCPQTQVNLKDSVKHLRLKSSDHQFSTLQGDHQILTCTVIINFEWHRS